MPRAVPSTFIRPAGPSLQAAYDHPRLSSGLASIRMTATRARSTATRLEAMSSWKAFSRTTASGDAEMQVFIDSKTEKPSAFLTCGVSRAAGHVGLV